jgi:hypothetical protein
MDEWIQIDIDGWMDGWMDGWTDGWMVKEVTLTHQSAAPPLSEASLAQI